MDCYPINVVNIYPIVQVWRDDMPGDIVSLVFADIR